MTVQSSSSEIVEACAQALADDYWHPPVKLSSLAKHDAERYRRQARLVLEAASVAQAAPEPVAIDRKTIVAAYREWAWTKDPDPPGLSLGQAAFLAGAKFAASLSSPVQTDVREALVKAKCTSSDGTVVHASMDDVLRALSVPSTEGK